MNVDSISNGVVIDHINAGFALRLYDLLGLSDMDCPVAIIKNANSKKYVRPIALRKDLRQQGGYSPYCQLKMRATASASAPTPFPHGFGSHIKCGTHHTGAPLSLNTHILSYIIMYVNTFLRKNNINIDSKCVLWYTLKKHSRGAL